MYYLMVETWCYPLKLFRYEVTSLHLHSSLGARKVSSTEPDHNLHTGINKTAEASEHLVNLVEAVCGNCAVR